MSKLHLKENPTLADVFIVFLHLCNLLNIDLEQAFRDKEEKNRQRIWK